MKIEFHLKTILESQRESKPEKYKFRETVNEVFIECQIFETKNQLFCATIYFIIYSLTGTFFIPTETGPVSFTQSKLQDNIVRDKESYYCLW